MVWYQSSLHPCSVGKWETISYLPFRLGCFRHIAHLFLSVYLSFYLSVSKSHYIYFFATNSISDGPCFFVTFLLVLSNINRIAATTATVTTSMTVTPTMTASKSLSQPNSIRQTKKNTALADAVSGVLASLVALWTFYPMDVINTNIQASTKSPTLVKHLLQGLPVKTLHTTASSFCYFYIHSHVVSYWNTYRQQSKESTISQLILSALAAAINTCLTLPLDDMASRQQTSTLLSCSNKVPSTSSQNTVNDLRSLWKGLWPSLLLCVNPAIHYTVFGVLKSRRLQDNNHSHNKNQINNHSQLQLSMRDAFIIGLLAKFTATMATYPLIRAKVMIMVTSNTANHSFIHCLRTEYQRNGFLGLYTGCHLQLLHTLLKSALLMMVRERITKTTHRFVLPSLDTRQQQWQQQWQ